VESFRYSRAPSILLREGPRIPIDISAISSEIREGKLVGLEIPAIPLRISGLIDTGSSFTVVSPEIDKQCKLRATGYNATVASMKNVGEYPEYAAWIRFPGTGLQELDGTPVVVIEIKQVNPPRYDCIIGRDILQRWLLTYNGGGTVSIQELH